MLLQVCKVVRIWDEDQPPPNKCSPGLTPPFLHTVSDQKLDGEKASPSASWVGLGIRLGRVMLLQQNHNGRASCLELLHLNTS